MGNKAELNQQVFSSCLESCEGFWSVKSPPLGASVVSAPIRFPSSQDCALLVVISFTRHLIADPDTMGGGTQSSNKPAGKNGATKL